MKRIGLLGSLLVLLTTVALIRTIPASSNPPRPLFSQESEHERRVSARRALNGSPLPLSYRSPGATHKVLLAADQIELQNRLLASNSRRRARKYESYSLIEVSGDELSLIDAGTLERIEVRDDFNLIMLKSGQIDTTGPDPQVRTDLCQPNFLRHSLHLVQLFGPPTPDSIRALRSTGARVVSYIPNNTYLMWATSAQLAALRAPRHDSGTIQWDGPFHPAYKLDPRIKLDSLEQIATSIEIVDAPDGIQTIAAIKSAVREVLAPEFRAGGTLHVKVRAESSQLAELARRPDVILIEPWAEYRLHDERANQIVAGAISQETVNSRVVGRPTSPGYLPFLNSLGFTSTFDFAVDVADTGLDVGSDDPGKIHPDFLDTSNGSRVAYLHDFSSDSSPDNPTHDTSGHGTLNASILGGFNNKTGDAFTDPLGFHYGLGIAPFVRIGGSKIFDNGGRFRAGGSLVQYISQAYNAGARISTNSWGACSFGSGFCNLYGDDCVIFDSLVRDADPLTPGNQGITIVFSAGNDGDAGTGSINLPGTAKNVITVGASENFRDAGPDGVEVSDGCKVSSAQADNALDIVDFSSGGPLQDGRAKPDLVAPGTHIQGAASQDPAFSGSGVCGAGTSPYFPLGQKLYTWSSGTSHSTPIVAGAAALAFQWLRNTLGAQPSPALVKAFLLNSTHYLTGKLGGDNLPGARQGWGLLDLAKAFEATDRVIYDQDPSRTFSQSGGAPFEVFGLIGDSSQEFRVMLGWSDAPGSAATNAPYVNQLNLEVIVNGVLYSGNNFIGQYSTPGGRADIVNNVQAVRLPRGTTGSFVVRVLPALIAGDGVPGNELDLDQDFALVVTNGREAPVPVLGVDSFEGVSQGVTVEHPGGRGDSFLIPGELARIRVIVNNLSRSAAANITSAGLSIFTSGGAVGSSGSSSFPVIEPGGSGANSGPFEIRVPPDLPCGSRARLELKMITPFGQVNLPVSIRVGRPLQTLIQTVLLFDDVDSGLVRWKLKKFAVDGGTAHSGAKSYRAVDPGNANGDTQLSILMMKKRVAIPAGAGNARLSFFHIFNFERGYDGGVLEASTDGGETWQDLGSRAIVGGYDGQVTAASNNPLGSRLAWTARGRPGVFTQVVIRLDEFAGQTLRLRFLAGFDEAIGISEGFTGWFIDDIKITTDVFTCSN